MSLMQLNMVYRRNLRASPECQSFCPSDGSNPLCLLCLIERARKAFVAVIWLAIIYSWPKEEFLGDRVVKLSSHDWRH